ncbi:MAG: DUF805 domain-containing protein [Alphaproteobacteria bacterium]|nr:DUF805 domain-containing protein [Alphaproteobacteria bacterium]
MNRATYWLCVGLFVALVVALNFLGPKARIPGEVILVFVCVPRLHDIGLSGWYFLIGIAVEILGLAVGFTLFPADQALIGIGIAAFLIALLLLWLGVRPGEVGPNAWGDPPGPGLQFKPAK